MKLTGGSLKINELMMLLKASYEEIQIKINNI
jgi:hypothetical protein